MRRIACTPSPRISVPPPTGVGRQDPPGPALGHRSAQPDRLAGGPEAGARHVASAGPGRRGRRLGDRTASDGARLRGPRCPSTRRWPSPTRRSGRRTSRSPTMRRAADAHPARGGLGCQRVARHATAEAANPFESVLRAICLEVPGLSAVPQVRSLTTGSTPGSTWLTFGFGSSSRPTASSSTAPGSSCARTAGATTSYGPRGWAVLRFTWEHVMFAPELGPRSILVETVRHAREQALVA